MPKPASLLPDLFETPWRRADWLWVLALALAVRLLNLWAMPEDPAAFQFPDSGGYLAATARWLESGSWAGWLAGERLLPDERMPGYFWILAGLSRLGLGSPAGIALAQGIVDAGTCAVIARMAALYSPAAGRIGGLLAALSPTLVIHSTLVLQDTMFLHLFAWALLLAAVTVRDRDPRWALLAGTLLGAAFMVRAVVQYLVLLLPLALAAGVLLRHRRVVPAIAVALLTLLGSLAPAAPLLYRNIVHLDTVYPTTQTGLHALFWLVPLVRMTETGRTFDEESAINQREVADLLAARGIDPSALSPAAADRVYRQLARERLLALPLPRIAQAWTQGAVLTLFAPATLSDGRVRSLERPSFYGTPGHSLIDRGANYMFRPFGTFQAVILASALVSLAAALALAAGGWTLIRTAPLAAAGIVLLVAYFLALGGPTSGPKYRVPFHPVLLVTMAVGVAAVLDRLRRRSG